MGRAVITANKGDGLYDILLQYDRGKIPDRLAAISLRLTELTNTLIPTAEAEVEAAQIALQYAVGDEIPKATATLFAKQRTLAFLRLEKISLQKEQSRLNAVPQTMARANVWCTDYTIDLSPNTIVGTMEINGEQSKIILTPGGDDDIGIMQPAGANTPAGTFFNLAIFPWWQRWKPTYRIGEIKEIDYATNTASVCIEDVRSAYQGVLINPPSGPICSHSITSAISGFEDFARRYPDDPLVTNTASTEIPLTAQLLADMQEINTEVNDYHKYIPDIDTTGSLEKWDYLVEGTGGDCEDFALTKAKKLLEKGYPASAIHIEVGQTQNGAGHAWVVVQTDAGDYALDMNYKDVMLNNRINYSDRIRQTGKNWIKTGRLYTSVPIEYMDKTNAAAFSVGDRVVVQLSNQSWTSPKVIGFESNPKRGKYILCLGSPTGVYMPHLRVYTPGGKLKYVINFPLTSEWYVKNIAVSDGIIFAEAHKGGYDEPLIICIYKYKLETGEYLGNFVIPDLYLSPEVKISEFRTADMSATKLGDSRYIYISGNTLRYVWYPWPGWVNVPGYGIQMIREDGVRVGYWLNEPGYDVDHNRLAFCGDSLYYYPGDNPAPSDYFKQYILKLNAYLGGDWKIINNSDIVPQEFTVGESGESREIIISGTSLEKALYGVLNSGGNEIFRNANYYFDPMVRYEETSNEETGKNTTFIGWDPTRPKHLTFFNWNLSDVRQVEFEGLQDYVTRIAVSGIDN